MNHRILSHVDDLGRARIVVVAAATLAFASKVILAASTFGPPDVVYFEAFSQAIAKSGPIRIYEQPLGHLPVYNHPPLAGWMLLGLHEISGWGLPFSTLIRFPACFADFVTCILVFEIVQHRARTRTAAFCALGAALCPVLALTSGWHGNTDSVAVMFAFAAAYLLVDRPNPVLAGCAAAMSISIKLPPIVAVPLFFLAAWRLGGRTMLLRFGAAFATLFLAIWGPVIATAPGPLREKVLEFPGGGQRYWGLTAFAQAAGLPESVITFVRGDTHFLFVLFCTAVGLWLVWRRPAALSVALATTLGLLLLLSTASGAQYLAWPAAGLFVIGLREGIAYALVVGSFAAGIYAMFADLVGPDSWYSSVVEGANVIGWLVLAFGVASGIRATLGPGPEPPADGAVPLAVGKPRAEVQSSSFANRP
ncbi:glycosyltransferase family 39 protein [Streptomyces himalayensis]|uniref:Glycosyltransferase RgtA/B/C/D-like domain-containing protein n=1 Tax=Streptomyces himalayensis subsp. himalayensis TaxID=2756131 RepID=A0A7W0DQQ5_9ACTN|nr:hypothetical protein [Streptomyces himalayensis]MBA2949511.1 hypothetical protein [Streptomyces himalayensis subsp. himalayensis]